MIWRETAQLERTLGAKAEDLSFELRALTIGRTNFCKLSSDSHKPTVVLTLSHRHIYKIMSYFLSFFFFY